MASGDEIMTVRITGPDVTETRAREVGEAAADLVNAVAEQMGLPPGLVRPGEVRVACDGDGCDARRALDSQGDGWVRSERGEDFCPTCAADLAEETGA